MIRFHCLDCEKAIDSDDSVAGLPIRCPHCHATVEVPRQASTPPPRREEILRGEHEPGPVEFLIHGRVSNIAPPRDEPHPKLKPPDKPGPCLFCTEEPVEARTAFVRIRKGSMGHRIEGYVKCRCCQGCFDRVNAWDRLRFWFMGLMFGSLAFAFCGGIPLAVMIGGKDKEHSTPLQTTLAIGVLVIPMAGFFLAPIALFFTRGWRAAKIMHPATNRLLKRLLGTPWWGLGNHAWMERKPPPGAEYLEFEER